MGAGEGIPSYVAHSAEDGRLEPLEAHLREVSEMAARFAEPLGMAELAADKMKVEIAAAGCMNLLGRCRVTLKLFQQDGGTRNRAPPSKVFATCSTRRWAIS